MELNYRQAGLDDLACLVQMLANDSLGANRESAAMGMLDSYQQAFEHISGDPNNELVVVELDEVIVASLQMTYIPYLTYQGSWRALIEGVRVHQDYRSRGIGKLVFTWALEQARKRGVQYGAVDLG